LFGKWHHRELITTKVLDGDTCDFWVPEGRGGSGSEGCHGEYKTVGECVVWELYRDW
jgi:hypothetical protein